MISCQNQKKLLPNPLKPDRFISMGKKYLGGFKQSFERIEVKNNFQSIHHIMTTNYQ